MQISIDHNSTVPLHMQLLNQLRHLILSGHWPPGSRIPSETNLQTQLTISRSTIRQAFSNAEAEGLIQRVPGKGTFVAQPPANGAPSRLIGYVTVDFLSGDFQYQLLSGIESAVKAKGYRLLFCNSNNRIEGENELLEQLLEDKVSGILIWPVVHPDPSRKLFQLARQEALPVVLIDRTFGGLAFDCVTSKNYAAGYAATEHLLKLGHRHIVFLTHSFLQLPPVSERLRGYRAAMQEAHLMPLEPWFIQMDHEMGTRSALAAYREAAGPEIDQIARCLDRVQRPTAIFALNDLIALLTMQAARLVGLRIPEELSVVGFDDMDIVAHLEIPLTTVAQDTFMIGKRAAELLIERIEGYDAPTRQEAIPTQLKVRASTAPPAIPPVAEKISQAVFK